mmetsp:Transcript_46336/g.148398  ORF Transcript_46336/g.148398 Transcript_46336/m.148398 type:complete len:371 (-) Transcript_46336:1547-2659(-)
MGEALRVHIGGAELLDGEGEALAVHELEVRGERLDVHGLDLVVLGPDNLARGVHGGDGLLAADLDHDGALVVADGDLVGAPDIPEGPHALQAVVERALETVGRRVPHLDRAVLGAGHDDGELRVKGHARHVVGVALEGLHALLGLVVPDLDQLVVRARDEVGLVAAREVVDAVHPLLVPLQGEVGDGLPDTPHLDGAVQGCRGEGVGVLGVEAHLHDVVGVPLEHLGALPILAPVPELDEHVIGGRQEVGHGGVHRHAPDVVGVRLKGLDLVHGVVVEHADEHIISATHNPLLPGHKLGRADGQIRHLERLDERRVVVVPDVDVSVVKVGENPWLGRMDIHALDAIRPLGKNPLDIQAERHRESLGSMCG